MKLYLAYFWRVRTLEELAFENDFLTQEMRSRGDHKKYDVKVYYWLPVS